MSRRSVVSPVRRTKATQHELDYDDLSTRYEVGDPTECRHAQEYEKEELMLRDTFLKTLRRCLPPGGKVVAITPEAHTWCFKVSVSGDDTRGYTDQLRKDWPGQLSLLRGASGTNGESVDYWRVAYLVKKETIALKIVSACFTSFLVLILLAVLVTTVLLFGPTSLRQLLWDFFE